MARNEDKTSSWLAMGLLIVLVILLYDRVGLRQLQQLRHQADDKRL